MRTIARAAQCQPCRDEKMPQWIFRLLLLRRYFSHTLCRGLRLAQKSYTITMRSRDHHDRHLGACSLHLAHVGPRPASARRGYSDGLLFAEFSTCSQRSTQRHHISRFATEVTRALLAGMSLLERQSVGTATLLSYQKVLVAFTTPFCGATVW